MTDVAENRRYMSSDATICSFVYAAGFVDPPRKRTCKFNDNDRPREEEVSLSEGNNEDTDDRQKLINRFLPRNRG